MATIASLEKDKRVVEVTKTEKDIIEKIYTVVEIKTPREDIQNLIDSKNEDIKLIEKDIAELETKLK